MCGIAGWVDFARDLTTEEAVIRRMTATLARRGPDGEGVWLSTHAALGHRRMSVIDRAGGEQPMVAAADGRPRAVITYCSEVYNFRELRVQLAARGHTFSTDSDTEVVLRSYLEWGDRLAEKLNGIFAFAVWDTTRETLLLVRDRLGVKPLYYYPTRDGLLFGSEPKAILAHPAVRAAVDLDGLRELLSLAATPGEAVYRGLREVRPGELVEVSRAGISRRRYWALPSGEHTDDRARTVDTVRGLLTEAVGLQLVSDVPLCTLLSGGLDSSVIAALAAEAQRERGAGPLRTFSLDFAGYVENFHPEYMRETPDPPYARRMARHIGSRHTDIVLTTADLTAPAHHSASLLAHDLPYGRGDRDTSLYLLTRAVREECRVALTGESADEVFGGYQWFHQPGVLARPTFPWLAMFGHVTDDGPDSRSSLLDRTLLKQLDLPGYRDAAYRAALAEVPAAEGPERRPREIGHLTLTRLLPLLLARADRMSMANGLELRVPFLDHRLVEYVFTVPWSLKGAGDLEKGLLREATSDLLPPSIARRRKAPFPATQDPGYEQRLRIALGELAADSPVGPLVDRDRVRALSTSPVGAITSNEERSHIELVLGLDAWLRRYDVTLDLAG